MRIESSQLPASIIQHYLDKGKTYEEIAKFACSAQETKDGDKFKVGNDRWEYKNHRWQKTTDGKKPRNYS